MVQTPGHTMAEMAAGTQIDSATLDLLFDFYQYRYVCDNVRFPVYFRRELQKLQWQYNNLLRLESVEWDPTVSDYLERWTVGTKYDRADRAAHEKGDHSAETNGGNESGGTDKVHTTGDTTAAATQRSLSGDTPDSSMYPGDPGTPIGDYTNGMPKKLNWTYTTAQSEGDSHNTGHDETDTGTTYGRTDTHHNHTFGHSDRYNWTNDIVRGNTDNREQTVGRHEAIQDMLARCRDYIYGSNAFAWLLDRMEPCFFAFYDLEGDW